MVLALKTHTLTPLQGSLLLMTLTQGGVLTHLPWARDLQAFGLGVDGVLTHAFNACLMILKVENRVNLTSSTAFKNHTILFDMASRSYNGRLDALVALTGKAVTVPPMAAVEDMEGAIVYRASIVVNCSWLSAPLRHRLEQSNIICLKLIND